MIKFICFTLLVLLLLLSTLIYWCFNKHLGTACLFGSSVYINISSYLLLMSTYLFQPSILHPIYIILLAAVLFAIWYAERIFLIERATRHTGYTIFLVSSLLLLGFAKLLLSWGTIDFQYFQIATVASGFSCGMLLGLFLEDTLVRFSTRCFYWQEQLLKITVGFLICALIQYMLYRFYSLPALGFLLSALTSLWISGLCPVFIRKIQHYQYENH